MEGHSKFASELLLHAACGVPLAAEAGLLSRLLLSSGGAPTSASTYELQPSAICRVILHAGASVHHLQHLLEEVQSAVVLCPAVVPQLLETLLPQHRQELALRLTQLRQQYIDYQQQQEPQDGVLPDPAAAEAFMQQLQELSAVDVLLMTSLASQQWQADVSFVLMQGVMQTPSLQQLSSLLQELAATADVAADWLMDVGLNWCRTCHLDLPQGFEAAGVRLLQAAVWSKPQLSTTTLQRVVKHLLAESAPNSHFWAVLQYAVQQCCHWHSSHQHQQQQQGMQTPLQLDRPATAGAVVAGAAAAAAGDLTSALAAVCEQELLAGLTAVMSRLQQQQERHLARVQSAQMAVQYCSTIAPLAAVSCDVLQALLQCAVDAVQQHQGLPLQKRGNAAAVKVEEECLPPQQQEQQQQPEGITVHGHHSPRTAAAAAAGGAGGGSSSGTHGVIGSGSGSVLQTPGSMRKKPRYSWGLNQRRPVPAFSSPAACGVPSQGTQQGPQGVPKQPQPQQQQQWQEHMHGAGSIAGADKDVAVAAQQLHLSEMQPQQVVPSQSQSQRSHEQQQHEQQQHADQHAQAEQKSGDAQNALLSPGDAAAQLKHQLELLRSLQGQSTSSQPVKSRAGRRQLPSAAVVAAAAELPPYEQLAVAAAADALCSAAVGSAGPCDSAACQACMASLLQELLAGLSAAAVQQLSEVVAQVLQHQQQGQGRQCRCCDKTQPLLPLQQPQNGAAQQPDNQRAVSRVADLWYQAVLQQLQSAVSASLQAAAAAAAGSAQDMESGGRVCTPAGSMPTVLDPSVPVLLQLLAAEARQGVGSCSSRRGSSRQDSQLQIVLAQLLLLLLMAGSSAAGAAPDGSVIATTTAAAAGSDGVFPAAATADCTAGHAARAPAAAQTNQAASEAVRQCAARAEQLLLRWHTLSLLLSWLLQDAGLAEAVAQEVTATAARAAAGGSSDYNTLPAQPSAAAGESGPSAEPQVANPGAAVRQPLQPALEKAVLCLQQLQQWQLPAALDLLATAHTAAVKEQQAAAAAAVVVNSQQTQLDAYGGWQDQGGGSAPGSSQKKRSKQEGGFFVIKRTPAAAATAAASPPKSTAAAGAGGAAPVPMDSTPGLRQDGVERQQQGPQQKAQQRLWQLAPSLLQPPEPLGMQACVRLLGAACSSIQDAQAALQQQRQQEQQQGQLVGATPNSRRHSSRLGSSPAPSAVAAAQAAGGVVGSVPDAASGTASGQNPPGAEEAAAAGAAAAGGGAEVTAAGILSAAAAAAVGISGSRRCSGSAAQLATSLQQAMQHSRLAVASILEASQVPSHQQQQLQQEQQQQHEHCLHAVVLLLELARLCRVGTGPIQQHQQLLQQLSGLACRCVGAAAELLETWWDHLCRANDGTTTSNGSSLHEAAAAAAQQLQPLLLPGLGHDRVAGGGGSGARRRSSGALGGSTAELFGVQYSQVLHVLQLAWLGPSGWAHTCKVAQQEPLLGLLLALSCQVDAQLSQLDELCQEAARRQHTPAATAATAEVAAAHITAQVKLLAALRKIVEGVYAPAAPVAAGAPASQPEALAPSAAAAATVLQPGRVASGSGGGSSGGSSSSKAHWLLGALDHWLLELAVGFSLDPCIASLPKAASACARHALLLSTTCRPPRRSSSNSSSLFSSPTLNTARLVHCMCLHYSPRVYLAGSVGAGRVWGRGGGLEAGPGKGPAWVLSLSRQAAADVARQTLTYLTHKLTGLVMVTSPGGSLGSSQGSSSSGAGGTVLGDVWGQLLAATMSMEAVAAGSEGLDTAAVQGLLNWLCEQAAAVATVCCCVELLLGCRTAAAKAAAKAHNHQQRLLLAAEGTVDLDAVAREARAVFAALTAVLSGPCSAAVAALRQQLCTRQQQEEAQGLQAGVDMQQRLREPAAEQQPDAADAIAAAAAAAAAALAGEEAAAAVSEAMSPVGIMAAAEVGDVGPTGLGQPQDQAAAVAAASDQQMANASDAVTPTPVKQGRGRPRKYPLVSPPASTGPKRGRGRPRKDAPPATPAAGAAADVLPQDAAAEEATELAPPAAGDDPDAVGGDSTAAAAANSPAASQPATAADGADSTAAPPASASQAAQHRNSSVSKAAAKQQQLLAARAQEAAKKVDACQEMLCILAGLGVAVGELSVRMFNPQRQQQQSQHDQLQPEQQLHGGSGTAGGCGAAAGVWVQALQQQQQQPGPDLLQQLQQQLRAWPAEWQALQADLATASSTEQQDASAAARAVAAGAAAVAQILEGSVQLCRVQRRKDAWEAVKAAAAAAAAADAADDSGSDADEPDSPARPPRPGSAGAAERVGAAAGRQDSRQAQLGINSVGQAASAAAAALAAARFCDPDVREELPYIFGVLTSDDEDDHPSPAAAVAGGAGNCRTAAPAAGSNPGTAAAANGVGARDGDAFNGFRTPARRILSVATPSSSARRPAAGATGGLAALAKAVAATAAVRTAPGSSGGFKTPASVPPRSKHSVVKPAAAAVADLGSQLELEATFATPRQAQRTPQQQQQQQQRTGAGHSTPGTAAAALAAAKRAAAAAQLVRSGAVLSPERRSAAAAGGSSRGAATAVTPSAGAHKHPHSSTKQAQTPACKPASAGQRQLQQKESAPAPSPMVAQQQKGKLSAEQQQLGVVEVFCAGLSAQYDAAQNMVGLQDGTWVTPTAFEKLAGKGSCKNWKKSVLVRVSTGQGDAEGDKFVSVCKWLSGEVSAAGVHAAEQQQQQGLQRGSGAKKREREDEGAQVQLEEEHEEGGVSEEDWEAQQQQPQQPRVTPAAKRRRLAYGSAAKECKQQQQQQQQDSNSDSLEPESQEPVRNSFIAACLNEARRRGGGGVNSGSQRSRAPPPARQAGRGGASAAAAAGAAAATGCSDLSEASDDDDDDDEACEGDGEDDYSDLEDFIVCEPSTDYSKLLSRLGKQVSWRHCWRGAGKGRH